jgi:hypothetical protein
MLLEGMYERAIQRGQAKLARSWAVKAREYRREADAVRDSMRRIDAIARSTRAKERSES